MHPSCLVPTAPACGAVGDNSRMHHTLIENLGDVFEKASFSGLTLPSSIPDHGERVMQHWAEINLMTLQKLIETMPQRVCDVIKAKGDPTKY